MEAYFHLKGMKRGASPYLKDEYEMVVYKNVNEGEISLKDQQKGEQSKMPKLLGKIRLRDQCYRKDRLQTIKQDQREIR